MPSPRPLAWSALFAALLLAAPAAALDPTRAFRDYELQQWGIQHGLPQISVLAIAQDPGGFIWVGTQGGVARLDGLRFVAFDRARGGIDTTMAGSIAIAADGTVWFGTPRGALRVKGDRVAEFSSVGTQLSVRAIAFDATGAPLFATERGLYRLQADRLEPHLIPSVPALQLFADGDALWVGSVGRLLRLRGAAVETFALPDPELRVTHIARRGARLVLGTSAGVHEFDPARGALSARLAPAFDEAVEALAVDREDSVWVGASSGLLRVTPRGAVERVEPEAFGGRPWVNALFVDPNGDLWIGTRRESLYRVHDSALRVRSTRDGLDDSLAWSVLADGDGLLVGTNSSLMRLGADGRYAALRATGRLPQASVYTMLRDDDGAVWIGTRSGAARLERGRITVPPALDALQGRQVFAMLRDGTALWFGTNDGLFRLQGGALDAVVAPAGTAETRVRCLFREADGVLLLCTEAGVRRLRGGKLEKVAWAAEFENVFVTRIAEARPGLLAIGTFGSGLGLVIGDRMVVLGTEQGLPSRNGWTLDVANDHLYVGSLDGIYRIPVPALLDAAAARPTRVAAEVIAASGYAESSVRGFACCNGGGHARSARLGTRIFYPSTEGVVEVDTEHVAPPPRAPRAVIETLHHAGIGHPADGRHTIGAANRDVAIDFTGVSFLRAYAIEFRYRLEGYDADWIEAGRRRTAFYTHLPPGEFRFVVQARHPLGAWSETAAPLALTVEPAWWERRLVQVLGVLLLLAGVAGAWRARLAQLRARTATLEQAVAERTGELARANERLRVANQTLALENQTDPLTGLYNRRFVLNHAFRRGGVARANDRCAVLVVEVDDFKQINERHGQGSGDRVLVDLGQLLSACVRGGDIVARWTGVAFLLVLPGLDESGALELATRLRRRIVGTEFQADDDAPLRVSATIGFAHHAPRGPDDDGAQLTLDLADAALQRAKRTARERVVGLRRVSAQLPASLTTAEAEAAVASGLLAWVETTDTGG